jgi:hypothetical protein
MVKTLCDYLLHKNYGVSFFLKAIPKPKVRDVDFVFLGKSSIIESETIG